jgi:hypothetical protein
MIRFIRLNRETGEILGYGYGGTLEGFMIDQEATKENELLLLSDEATLNDAVEIDLEDLGFVHKLEEKPEGWGLELRAGKKKQKDMTPEEITSALSRRK